MAEKRSETITNTRENAGARRDDAGRQESGLARRAQQSTFMNPLVQQH